MDTKSKSNEIAINTTVRRHFAGQRGVMLLCLLLCAMLALGTLLYGGRSFTATNRTYQTVYQQADFSSKLYQFSYLHYWKLMQKEADNFTLTPTEVFFPNYRQLSAAQNGIYPENYSSDEEYADAVKGSTSYTDESYESFSQSLMANMNGLAQEFDSQWANTGWFVMNTETGVTLGTPDPALLSLTQGSATPQEITALQDQYAYYAVLRFGASGSLGVPTVYGAPHDSMDILQTTDMTGWLLSIAGQDLDEPQLFDAMHPPQNMVAVFPIPQNMVSSFYADAYNYDMTYLYQTGIPMVYYAALFIAMGVAVLLWLKPGSRLKKNPAARLAPELSLLAFSFSINFFSRWLDYRLMRQFRGDYIAELTAQGIPNPAGFLLSYGFFAAVLAVIFLIGMAAAASAMQIKELGFMEYLRQRSLCLLFWRRFSTQIKAVFHWIIDIDLSEKSNKTIIKILAANFVILALLCSIWVFGIFGLVVYTLILYIVLRNYSRKLKQHYAKLLDATGQMAAGQLDVHIDEKLGVFTPLGKELVKVQQGFTVAVQEQTRSQRMKTELISNVSHDLKTPLTAIITYVNLLKDEGVTEEDRRSYVATLDAKSQRLKRLIEDLFEMSKASSGNIVLHPTRVDLPALVRQVELEARDELAEANIEFRYNFPPGKIELLLDGEKTSRIFENLIINVAKYGMPGTRAYVTIVAGEKLVTLEMKNVSKNELAFDSGEITDRFMRGDTSRSSSGSGLGLAIAKSFTEAQGAQFKIVTDGDMFKAYITFSRVPGVAVPRPMIQTQPRTPPAQEAAASFTAPTNTFKTPAAAFAEQPPQQPQYPGTYPPPRYLNGNYNSYAPPQGPANPPANQGFANMTLNQVADAATSAASSAVNAVASVARQAADKAKLVGEKAKEEQQLAKQAIQMAKAEAKAAAKRLKQETKAARKNRKYSYAPMPDSPPPQPTGQPYYPPAYAPAYSPPANPEPPPTEVVNPEQLFQSIHSPQEPHIINAEPEIILKVPVDASVPYGEEIYMANSPDSTPALTLFPDTDALDLPALRPELELYPIPDLIVSAHPQEENGQHSDSEAPMPPAP